MFYDPTYSLRSAVENMAVNNPSLIRIHDEETSLVVSITYDEPNQTLRPLLDAKKYTPDEPKNDSNMEKILAISKLSESHIQFKFKMFKTSSYTHIS